MSKKIISSGHLRIMLVSSPMIHCLYIGENKTRSAGWYGGEKEKVVSFELGVDLFYSVKEIN
jgi:hypothetical protein